MLPKRHIQPGNVVHAFTNSGGTFTPTESEVTDKLTQIDDHHYQILSKSKTRTIYEVPSGVTVSSKVPFDAPIHQQIDRNDNTNTFTWDAQGKRLTRIEGPDPSQYLKFTWTNDRGPDKVFDHTGRCVVYSYQSYTRSHRECEEAPQDWLLTKIVQPGQKTYEQTYHQPLGDPKDYQLLSMSLNGVLQEKVVSSDDLPSSIQEVTHRLGATLSFSRDNSGATPLTTVTKTAPSGLPQSQNQVQKYHLNGEDRVLDVTDNLNRQASVTYDEQDNVTNTTDFKGQTTSTTYDSRRNPLTVTDNLGHTTTFTWNADDTLASIQDALGQTASMTYDQHFNVLSVTDQANHTSRMTYTTFGKLQTATDPLGHTTTLNYNSLGFLSGKTLPPAGSGQPAAHWAYNVDSLGRRISTLDPLNRRTKAVYDERNHIIDTTVPAVTASYRQSSLPEGHITAQYDSNDLLLARTALDGLVTTYDYDSANKLIAVHTPGTTRPTLLKYDILEHVIQTTNANGQSTNYDFDQVNRIIKKTYPGGSSESYNYDANNNLIKWDRGAFAIDYTYDGLDRLQHISSPATHDDIVLGYDELNRVASMVDNSGTTTYSYTSNSLLASVTHPGSKTLAYSYDQADRLSSLLDPEGLTTSYSYSDRNELTTVAHDGQSVSYVHDLVGRTTLTHMSNGVDARKAFSERNQLLFKEYDKGSSPLITLKYAFNQVGQRVVGEQIDPTGSALHRYGYNDRRELVASSLDGPRGAHSGIEYSLDQNDNITNNNGTPFTSNAADQLTKAGSSSLSYNGAGQATSVAGQSLTFAYNDQIKAITGQGLNAQYLYDGNGQRVQKTVNGVSQKFLWNGGSIAKEYKTDGSVRADYQLGAGAKIDGKWQFYLSDIQGSTLGVTDDTGKVVATWAYSDYGVTTQASGDKGLYQPFLYTQSELDSETGYYHNKARHYAPKYGKFLARDPIANNNLYCYCNVSFR